MRLPVPDKVLALRPSRVLERLGASKVCLLNSRDVLRVLRDKEVIVMACNTRIKHVIPGIMRAAEELDSVIAFELAKSECRIGGGYTGFDPESYASTVVEYARDVNFTRPFFIHGDHITVKSTSAEEIDSARRLIEAQLAAGYTSFAIDASFNELDDNVKITTELAKPIVERGLGLEVEVGEIKSAGQEASLTTVEEATAFISGLNANGIRPDMLAVNNGSKHGNYLEGEKIFIDLERTAQIYDAIKSAGVVIAQHGITGTPLHIVGRFADYGIRKGNVGTQWQNISHMGLPEDLMNEMKSWAVEHKKDVKMATRQFRSQIDSIPVESRKRIEEMACNEAKQLIRAFRAAGTASIVIEGLS